MEPAGKTANAQAATLGTLRAVFERVTTATTLQLAPAPAETRGEGFIEVCSWNASLSAQTGISSTGELTKAGEARQGLFKEDLRSIFRCIGERPVAICCQELGEGLHQAMATKECEKHGFRLVFAWD